MIAQNAGGAISYYVYNAHGDTTALFDTNGNRVYKYDIGAFGNNLSNSGTGTAAKFVYNGQYYDSETGLYYLRNRYYDPTTGRFTQEDPAKDGLNWYVYCGNNPVNFVDPWGLDPGDIFSSADEAAIDAGKYLMKLTLDKISVYYDEETVGYIYAVEGGYTYKQVENINDDKSGGFSTNEILEPSDCVIHTHIDYGYEGGENDTFSTPGNVNSNAPTSDIEGADNGNYVLYVATPTGVLKKYVPETYKQGDNDPGEVISTEMPQDRDYIARYLPKTLFYNLVKQKYQNVTDDEIFDAKYNNYVSLYDTLNAIEKINNEKKNVK